MIAPVTTVGIVSPLVGEMSGRTEGGAAERCPSTYFKGAF
jgi:hypothetical protein